MAPFLHTDTHPRLPAGLIPSPRHPWRSLKSQKRTERCFSASHKPSENLALISSAQSRHRLKRPGGFVPGRAFPAGKTARFRGQWAQEASVNVQFAPSNPPYHRQARFLP